MICTLCQRACGVDRANGEIGFCGMGEDAYLLGEVRSGAEPVALK